jgi:hypothetical protein
MCVKSMHYNTLDDKTGCNLWGRLDVLVVRLYIGLSLDLRVLQGVTIIRGGGVSRFEGYFEFLTAGS